MDSYFLSLLMALSGVVFAESGVGNNEILNQTLNETAAEAINEPEEVESLGWTGLMPAWAEGLAELLCQPFS
jgi:hypothetical protein